MDSHSVIADIVRAGAHVTTLVFRGCYEHIPSGYAQIILRGLITLAAPLGLLQLIDLGRSPVERLTITSRSMNFFEILPTLQSVPTARHIHFYIHNWSTNVASTLSAKYAHAESVEIIIGGQFPDTVSAVCCLRS